MPCDMRTRVPVEEQELRARSSRRTLRTTSPTSTVEREAFEHAFPVPQGPASCKRRRQLPFHPDANGYASADAHARAETQEMT
jgi:hypothetical protein